MTIGNSCPYLYACLSICIFVDAVEFELCITGLDPGFLERGGVAPGKDCER